MIYIKDMEMPESCKECPFCEVDFSDCTGSCLAYGRALIEDECFYDDGNRSTFCPLREEKDEISEGNL